MANRKDKFLKFWSNIVLNDNMPNLDERLTTVVEQLVKLQTENRNQSISKEISYITEYGGEPHRLTHFLSIVETHLAKTDEGRRTEIWQNIYNIKVVGRAKELLLNNSVTTWDEAKNLLTQHFRPLFNAKDITRKINNMKVSSIMELCIKIEQILGDIYSFSLYEINSPEVRKLLESTLIVKIKDTICGSLARDLRSEHDIHNIKKILYTYVGFDENIEKSYSNPKPRNPIHQSRERFDNNGSNRFKQPPEKSDRYRNNRQVFNPSGQFRNALQNPQPMEIDTIEKTESNNNIDQVFLN